MRQGEGVEGKGRGLWSCQLKPLMTDCRLLGTVTRSRFFQLRSVNPITPPYVSGMLRRLRPAPTHGRCPMWPVTRVGKECTNSSFDLRMIETAVLMQKQLKIRRTFLRGRSRAVSGLPPRIQVGSPSEHSLKQA